MYPTKQLVLNGILNFCEMYEKMLQAIWMVWPVSLLWRKLDENVFKIILEVGNFSFSRIFVENWKKKFLKVIESEFYNILEQKRSLSIFWRCIRSKTLSQYSNYFMYTFWCLKIPNVTAIYRKIDWFNAFLGIFIYVYMFETL